MAVIMGTNGNDVLLGTPNDDTIIGLEGNDYIQGLGGNNIINDGNGNDTLFGNADGITSLDNSASPLTFTVSPATLRSTYLNFSQDVTPTYGDNTLLAGSGTDVIYGAFYDFNITNNAPNVTFTTTAENNELVGIHNVNSSTTTLGNNMITVGDGDDIIHGNTNDLGVSIAGGITTNQVSGNRDSLILYNEENHQIVIGANQIIAGNGNDYVAGNVEDFRFSLNNGDTDLYNSGLRNYVSIENHLSSRVYFATNSITGGDGNDVVYGNMHNFNFANLGGNQNVEVSAQSVQGVFNSTYQTQSFVNFGINDITTGNGNDTVAGNLNDFSFSLLGPTITVTAAGHGGTYNINNSITNIIHFNSNDIVGGSGDNILMGNMHDMLDTVMGSTINATSSIDNTLNLNSLVSSKITFGGNILIDTGGGNNTLFGNMHQLELATLSATEDTGGVLTSNFQNHAIVQNDIYFGANNLSITSPGTLYGNMQNLVFDAGTSGANIVLGDNTLQGSGTLVSSINAYSLNSNVTSFTTSGKVGIEDSSGNSILWGNTTLTGHNAMADSFVFSLANTTDGKTVMQGNSVITNFNNDAGSLGDTLDIQQFSSSGSLNDHVSLTHATNSVGGTDTTLNFDGGGSIKLLGIDLASLNDIHHLVVS